jgi:hypothetical protein
MSLVTNGFTQEFDVPELWSTISTLPKSYNLALAAHFARVHQISGPGSCASERGKSIGCRAS